VPRDWLGCPILRTLGYKTLLHADEPDYQRAGLAATLARPLEWDKVAHFADNHSIMPVVAHVLGEYGGESVPHDVRRYLAQRLSAVARNNLQQTQEWRRIVELLDAAAIPVISIKGPSLALLAYRNVALREFRDLDLLLPPLDVIRACDLLSSNGYRLDFRSVGSRNNDVLQSPYRQIRLLNDQNGTAIEVHWEVLHEKLPFSMPVSLLFDSACQECQDGISFLSLSREHLLIFLCAHGTKHCWMSLHWLCDLACYVSQSPQIDWEKCIRQAELMNCGLVMTHSLLLAQQVLGLALPPVIERAIQRAKAEKTAAAALRFLFQNVDEPGGYESLRYHSAFAEGWCDQLHLAHQRVFVPATPDWKAVRLPSALSFLYYLIRPFRLVVKRLLNRAHRSSSAATNTAPTLKAESDRELNLSRRCRRLSQGAG
jgi:hypothetical protein